MKKLSDKLKRVGEMKMKEMLKRVISEEDGQGMVEYGLIIAAISLAAIAVIWAFGDDIATLFTNLSLDRPTTTTP